MHLCPGTVRAVSENERTMRLIDLAVRQALRSQCKFKLGAVLVAGRRVLAGGPNRKRNSPLVDYRHATFHAEEVVLRRVHNAAGTVMYVARINAQGASMMARPCNRCQRELEAAKVTRVYFTTGAGGVDFLDIPDRSSIPNSIS
ncbi:hypothetical protein ACIRD2_34305 [Streptomyces sp. NPDC093595]|uniref:hypothetical protein n=1 Tax=Streptomyces sp. NPDC093595 TaxID=3366045 RepID=UPI00381A9B87